MLVSETSPQDWNYVSEGSSTIVFSYTGPSHQRFSGAVLRLKKTTRLVLSNSRNSEHDDDITVAFQHNVIERLIPPEHLPRIESVEVDKPWLEVLAGLCDTVRPPERRRKDQIDVAARKATLATDLVGGVALSVELKVLSLPDVQYATPE
jgi:inositol-pentakisphosphate 2-kinase